MSDNDMSDEALSDWMDEFHSPWNLTYLDVWQECRRRAMNREVIAFQEGWEAACKTYPEILSNDTRKETRAKG